MKDCINCTHMGTSHLLLFFLIGKAFQSTRLTIDGRELSHIKSQAKDSERGSRLKETVAKVTCHSALAIVGLTGLYPH